MAKLEKTSKKVGSRAAQQLKNSKTQKDVTSVGASAPAQVSEREKGPAKKKNKK